MSLSGLRNRKVQKFYCKTSILQGQDLQVKKLILGQSDIALWITGEYKVVYTFYDDLDSRLYRVSGLGTLKRSWEINLQTYLF